MTIEQIKEKIQYGDYTILGSVLKLNAPAAKMRFLRGDEEAKSILEKIVENRDALIEKLSNENKT